MMIVPSPSPAFVGSTYRLSPATFPRSYVGVTAAAAFIGFTAL